MRVLGIDPGLGGALALLDTDLGLLTVQDMPTVAVRKSRSISEASLAQMIRDLAPDRAVVEAVHAMPKQGVTSSFNFGLGFGMVRGVLAASGVSWSLVTPQEWKAHFRLGRDKQQSRIIAGRLFPQNGRDFARVRDDGRAEAALLALFGSLA